MVGTSQKWPAKAGGRSRKGPAVAGTTVVKHGCGQLQSSGLISHMVVMIAMPVHWDCDPLK